MRKRHSNQHIPRSDREPLAKSKPALAKAFAPVMAASRFPVWLMAALLVLVTTALYWPATSHDFAIFNTGAIFITTLPCRGLLHIVICA